MGKKWTIDEGAPLKVRVVSDKERTDDSENLSERPIRTRIVRRIVKMLVALWVMSIGAWLHAGDRSHYMASNGDGPHDAIDGHDPFGGL